MTARHPVIVEVRPNGQVTVNGVLVAEVTVPDREGGEPAVIGRDRLEGELALHRIALIVAERLADLIRHCEDRRFTAGDAADFGAALLAGLTGQPGELTGRQPYRDGHRAGVTLRALRDHLVETLGPVPPPALLTDTELRRSAH